MLFNDIEREIIIKTQRMRKERYLTPSVQVVTEFETDCQILASSKVDATVMVDSVDEHYYGGEGDSNDDYLYEL